MLLPLAAEVVLAVVWRRATWRCEYWIRTGHRGGTVKLFASGTLVAERHVPQIDEMLRVAATWKQKAATNDDTEPWIQAVERRAGKPERRRVSRGGRRRDDLIKALGAD